MNASNCPRRSAAVLICCFRRFFVPRLFKHLALIALLVAASGQFSRCLAQGTAFTYQGRLTSSGVNPTGLFDFQFSLYNALTGGSQEGSTVTTTAVGVTNGLFTVTIDFGGVFNGTSLWLQIGTRTNGVGSYIALTPRQELTPTPYAITAENVDGSVEASQISGTLTAAVIPVPLDLSGATATPIIEANQSSTGGGVEGNVTSTTSTTAGVEGTTASTAGGAAGVYGLVSSTSPGGYSAGVYGVNNGTGGLGIGLYGSQNGSGWGVFGTTPSGYGVYGYSSGSGIGVAGGGNTGVGVLGTSASAIGVSGAHQATNGTAAGVQGTTDSLDGSADGVYGLVMQTNAGADSAGVLGVNSGTGYDGIGVYGSQAGSGYGVYGYTPSGYGVYGYSGSGIGVIGESSSGDGVFGSSSSAVGVNGVYDGSGTAAGVQGTTYSTSSSAYAVYGLVSPQSPGGFSAAVRGQNNGTNGLGIGVYGSQAGGGWGVYGTATSGYGVYGDSGSGSGVVGSSDSGDGVDGSSTSSVGVSGIYYGTGTAAGVQGTTYSTASGANAVYGIVESSEPGGDSAGVLGQNNGTNGLGIGVYGSQNGSGYGVYGYTPSGLGVYGYSSSGTGVEAGASSGTGVYTYSFSGSALTVGSGAIHVSGAGTNTSTAAFIQYATAANTSGHITTINNSICNGDPNAILIATHVYNAPGGVGTYVTHPYSVWYNGANWTIYYDDLTDISVGTAFNVLIIKN